MMRSARAVEQRAAAYQRGLAEAIATKMHAANDDPELDFLLLSLIDKLEALLWVLEVTDDDGITPYPSVAH